MPPALRRPTPIDACSRVTILFVLILSLLCYLGMTWRWPLEGDSQVLHYVSFLTAHGFAPYRDISDMNMPGAYLFDRWALAIFGHGDFGWRLCDYALSAILSSAMVWIARKYDWLAGMTAATLFVLTHGADGPPDAGQRDQLIATLLVLACACLFESVRKRQWRWMFPFAITSASAATVKPTFLPFTLVLFLCASIELKRNGIALKAYLSAAMAGFVIPFVVTLAFLLKYDSMQSFFLVFSQTLPHYKTLEPLTWAQMLARSLPLSVFVFVGFGSAAAYLLGKTKWNWEMATLLIAASLGGLSYLIQRKGFQQHRYTLVAFLLLWAALQLWIALQQIGATRAIAFAGLLVCCGYIVPIDFHRIRSYAQHDNFTEFLESDLSRLGPTQLQKNVQCLDIIDGCLTVLFHLGIVQSTGATGDLSLFQPIPAPQVGRDRETFSRWIQANPPDVYVESNFYFGQPRRDFDKVRNWPAFDADFSSNYSLVVQREFGNPPTSNLGTNPDLQGYRIYIRKSSSFELSRQP
jgi:hypothetical protein